MTVRPERPGPPPVLVLALLALSTSLPGCLKSPFDLGTGSGGSAPDAAVTTLPQTLDDTAAGSDDAVLGRRIALPSGLVYVDIAAGRGAMPRPGDRVQVHYTQTLHDGKVFDSTPAGQPFEFTFGVGDVIPGWDQGLSTMRVGGRRKLFVPPRLAFGTRGRWPSIPPDATLICDVELVQVRTGGGMMPE